MVDWVWGGGRYARQDNSHPVDANVERVMGCTDFVDTPDLCWEDMALALLLVNTNVLGAVALVLVLVMVPVVDVVVGMVPVAVVDNIAHR